MIANPDYYDDDTIGVYDNIGTLGIEIWQVKAGTKFGSFLITDDESLAHERCKVALEQTENTVKDEL